MSGYILCQIKKAEHPYFIENISTNIYSIEELCYYLYHNLYLIDSSIINEGLCVWLEEELGLAKLAARLRPHMGKFVSVEDVLYPIFKEINYLTYEELRFLNGNLALLDQEPVPLRKKHKGDLLVENRMYVNAIHVYQKLLERDDIDTVRQGFKGEIYHNLGCAYSYLIQMEKALDCFWKAYSDKKTARDLSCYLLAYKSIRSKEEFNRKIKELETDKLQAEILTEAKKEMEEALVRFEKIPEQEAVPENVDGMLETLTSEYHRSTGA